MRVLLPGLLALVIVVIVAEGPTYSGRDRHPYRLKSNQYSLFFSSIRFFAP
jgi:hypothetical protein